VSNSDLFALVYSPHFQSWCNVIADVVTTLASLGACTMATLHYFAWLREKTEAEAKKIEKDI
jgi:hypothetical protein